MDLKYKLSAKRKERMDAVLSSLRGQLDNTWVVDEQGNKRKLTDKEGAQK